MNARAGGSAALLALALAGSVLAGVSYALNGGLALSEALFAPTLFAAAAVVCFVVLVWRLPQADHALYACVVLLLGLSIVVVARLDPVRGARQLIWAVLGLALCVGTALALGRPRKLESYAYVCGTAAALLMLATIVFGSGRGGARLWLPLGPLTYQPSEAAKVLLCVFLAGYLSQRREVLARWTDRIFGLPLPHPRHLGPLVAMWAASLLLVIFQRDLGCALLLFCVFLVVLHAATNRWSLSGAGLAMFAAGAWAISHAFPHVRTRMQMWLNPWADPTGDGMQIIQSLYAVAQGGIVGTGVGRGLPTAVPEVATDFVFSAVAEELGLLGGAAVVIAFVIIVLRGAAAGARTRDDFLSLLAVGLAASLGVQALVIIAGVTKLLPLTGVTLPFLSYGGSSIVMSSIAVGILLRISATPALKAARAPSASGAVLGIAAALAGVLLFLVPWQGYWAVCRAEQLNFDPRNPRLFAVEQQIQRGSILDRAGRVLAQSAGPGAPRRYLAGPLLAHVIGYHDRRFGSAGVEASFGGYLLGLNRPSGGIVDVVKRRERRARGYDLRLSIDFELQRKACALLGERPGAVVALEPQTGDVLCLATWPTFDPNEIDNALRAARADPEHAPLVNRATQGLYPPGSSFKIFVASAALDSRAVDKNFTATCPGEEIIDDDRIRCWKAGGHGKLNMTQALAQSCNIYFAKLGRRLGAARFSHYVARFGLNERPPLEIEAAASRVPTGERLHPAMLLESSFGQGEVLVTPLQLALVACAIANEGRIPRPRLVLDVREADGTVVRSFAPRTWLRPIAPRAAREVREMMVAAVRPGGTAAAAAIAGVAVAGKTGTAENPRGRAHAWFVGIAPAERPKIVVAVCVEHGGSGGRVAAPIARELMKFWLGARGR